MWRNDMYEMNSDIKQFIKFGIVGITNTLIAYVFNIGTLYLLRNKEWEYDYIVANIVSFLLSVLWSFIWNNRYVFKAKEGEIRSIGRALLKTYISYAFTGIVLNNFLLYIWVGKLGISKLIAPLFNPIITLSVNFLLSKFWIFKSIKQYSENGDKDEE